MSVFVIARFETFSGQESEFGRVASALRQLAGTEPGVHSYEWHRGEEDGVYYAVEHFADSEAMLTHAGLAAELLAQLASASRMTSMELYGSVSRRLRAAVEPMSDGLTIFEVAELNA